MGKKNEIDQTKDEISFEDPSLHSEIVTQPNPILVGHTGLSKNVQDHENGKIHLDTGEDIESQEGDSLVDHDEQNRKFEAERQISGKISPYLEIEREEKDTETSSPKGKDEVEHSFVYQAILLTFCFIGLQASYLTWGVYQELVMTTEYGEGSDAEKFPSSAFLVFGNRILALVLAFMIVYSPFRKDKKKIGLNTPLLEFVPSSLSNIFSSWAQYEALKYVSFPTQTLSKSSKMIPVLLVGRLVHGKSYPWKEYLEALIITIGVGIFTLTEKTPKEGQDQGSDSFLGIFLLAFYLTCDSFTSQWQDKVFKKFHCDSYQMMLGVNICSVFLTSLSLFANGQFFNCFAFLQRHHDALIHNIILAVSSATGQLFIFYTIEKFGPITFTIIMTTRQMLSMVFSCILFGHSLAAMSFVGATIVFSTIGYRIYSKYKASQKKSKIIVKPKDGRNSNV